jgi:glycosyltransferase involved in cell wall biosynthesis
MFGGFSGVPHKPNEPQKPLGVLQTPHASPQAPQKPMGVVPDASPAPPAGRHGPLGVIPGPGQVSFPPDAPGGHLMASQVEAEWTGIFHGWSGYAKAHREVLKRAAVFSRLRISDDSHWDPKEPSPEIQALYRFHRSMTVTERAPRITFLPPERRKEKGYRIIYTMMETEKIHRDMIALMNEQFDECWVPTHWNHDTFGRSGLKIQTYVMPLGVDPGIYSPSVQPALPKAMLMTGPAAGKYEQPSGFLFISVFQPTFRKGYDVLIKTFEETFKNDPDVGLILGSTAYSLPHDEFPWKSMRSRIWALNSTYTEKQLAMIYKACKAYVSTSRGEGWNMPLGEAAAVGIPVIVPRTSVHPELVPEGAGYFFDKDQDRVFAEGRFLSPYFDGIAFPDYGPKSQKQLGEILRHVRKNYREAQEKAQKLRAHMVSKYTWTITARKVAERIRAICER